MKTVYCIKAIGGGLFVTKSDKTIRNYYVEADSKSNALAIFRNHWGTFSEAVKKRTTIVKMPYKVPAEEYEGKRIFR